MRVIFADGLEIVLSALKPAIATSRTRSNLKLLAQQLAPISRGILECRLASGMDQVDLQQCILAKNDEPQVLTEHLALLITSGAVERENWQCLYQFCQEWNSRGSDLNQVIQDLWLEFDLNDSNYFFPSIFLSFNPRAAGVENIFNLAEKALDLLSDYLATEGLRENLYRCFSACTFSTRISHLGLMLSRQPQVLRINVSQLKPNHISGYLQNIGFPGDIAAIETLVLQLLDFVDQIRICLDIGSAIYPNIGLECFFCQTLDLEARQANFFEYLVQQGLCTPEKRDALLAWSGYSTPHTSSDFWPSYLIAESFLKPPDRFSVFKRNLSHIKINYLSQQFLEAKGYLEFAHSWLESASHETQEVMTASQGT